MIIPFIDATLRDKESLQIGAEFSIVKIPQTYIQKLLEEPVLVANYERSLEKISTGLHYNGSDSNIGIFVSMLIRLVTGIPIDIPFWLETNIQNEISSFGQTLVRTYRNEKPRYSYVLDQDPAFVRLQNLSKQIDKLIKLFQQEEDKNRLIRGIEFVSIGFQTYHVPTRLVNQVTFLETLFTTSKNEITFQLASSISWYLAATETPEIRESKFNQVKNIYDARSRVVHGEHTNNPTRDLRKWLIEAEALNTEIFNAILKNGHIDYFSASETIRSRELRKLTIGVPCDYLKNV